MTPKKDADEKGPELQPGDKIDDRSTVTHEDGGKYRITRRGIYPRVQVQVERLA